MSKKTDFVNKALSYVGQKGTIFKNWYGLNDEWCAIFVSYCADQVGILGKIIYKTAGAGDFAREGVKLGYGKWIESKADGGKENPQIGDLILFDPTVKPYDEYMSRHVGIVTKVTADRVYTVEGNTNGSNHSNTVVAEHNYSLSSSDINGYFRPAWSKVDSASSGSSSSGSSSPSGSSSSPSVDIFYKVKTSGGAWLPEVKNTSDYAGLVGKKITDIALKVNKGSVKYRVHILGGGWLPYVTGYNTNDYNNGYAGNGKIIDAIEIIYAPASSSGKNVYYKVSPANRAYFPEQTGNIVNKTKGFDGYAGLFGTAIDRFQAYIK